MNQKRIASISFTQFQKPRDEVVGVSTKANVPVGIGSYTECLSSVRCTVTIWR